MELYSILSHNPAKAHLRAEYDPLYTSKYTVMGDLELSLLCVRNMTSESLRELGRHRKISVAHSILNNMQ